MRLTMNAIDKAIEVAGGVTRLAEKLAASPQVVANWKKRGVPAKRVLDVESATGIPRHELRPDIFGEQQ